MKYCLKNIIFMSMPTLIMGVDNIKPTDSFQIDFCSFVHSQHVLDRINSEIKPIFQTYDLEMISDGTICTLNNFGNIED